MKPGFIILNVGYNIVKEEESEMDTFLTLDSGSLLKAVQQHKIFKHIKLTI